MNDYDDTIFYERQEWLLDHCRADKDVMEDERGEYILEETEDENYRITTKKIYLPTNLRLE